MAPAADAPRESFEHRFRVRAAPAVAFALIADPSRLDALTPRWFRYRGPAAMPALAEGVAVPARIRWHGLPLPWESRITRWEPPLRFDYEQSRGPYGLFVHEHHVAPAEVGAEVRDRVHYRLPGGPLVRRFARPLVAHDLRRLFVHREHAVRTALEGRREPS